MSWRRVWTYVHRAVALRCAEALRIPGRREARVVAEGTLHRVEVRP